MTFAPAALEKLSELARQIGSKELAGEADDVAARTSENRFYVACVGQFKRGKSTLINALIGTPLLPTGVLPVTNLITVLRFGHRQQVFVSFVSGDRREVEVERIADYVSEQQNPGNQRGVALVEVYADSPMLASGMCLVDTPGLGSIFGENSATTRAFIPQVDVGLLVVGSDPPLSGEEAAIALEVSRETPHLIVVLSKADRLPTDEVELVREFTRTRLQDMLKTNVELFVVSSIERCTRDWCRLEKRLRELSNSARELAEAANRRAIERLALRLRRDVQEHRLALLAPIQETEQRLDATKTVVARAHSSLADLSYLFAGEQERLSLTLAAQRQYFLDRTIPTAEAELTQQKSDDQFNAAREIVQRHIQDWLTSIETEAERLYSAATDRFARLLLELGGEEIDRNLRARRRFYFTSLSEITSGTPFSLRRLAPAHYLRRLLDTNSARVINDLIDRIVESRRQLEKEIAAALTAIVAGAERTAQYAKAAHEAGREQVATEITRLENIDAELTALTGRGPS